MNGMVYSKLLLSLVLAVGLFLLASEAVCDDAIEAQADRLYAETLGADTPNQAKFSEAVSVWREMADAGDPVGDFYLSEAYFSGMAELVPRDPGRAMQLLRRAADSGLARAQFSLGWHLESGVPGPKDIAQAKAYYRLSANQKYPLAVSRMIRVYELGELGAVADEKAAAYWRSVADSL